MSFCCLQLIRSLTGVRQDVGCWRHYLLQSSTYCWQVNQLAADINMHKQHTSILIRAPTTTPFLLVHSAWIPSFNNDRATKSVGNPSPKTNSAITLLQMIVILADEQQPIFIQTVIIMRKINVMTNLLFEEQEQIKDLKLTGGVRKRSLW